MFIDKIRLAEDIEQFMFERGEYDFGDSDRIQWLKGLPDAYSIADNPYTLKEARNNVANKVHKDLQTGDGVLNLIKYISDQVAEMDEDDELISKAEYLLISLNRSKQIKDELAKELSTLIKEMLSSPET